jgi:fermentation-respiration switch protein FrsA (DUF1100 family)
VIRYLIVALVLLAIMKLLAWRLEPAMLFFPTRGEQETPSSLGIRYQPLRLQAADGVTITAWQFEPEHPRADIVYFHGNGGNLSLWLPVFETLHGYGYRVLAIDYRGYGTSEGTPSEKGLYLDAEAAVREAARSDTQRPLVFWGRSLGGAVAAAAARAHAPDGLILESTFPDKASVIRTALVLRALNVFASYRFDTVTMLKGFRKPVLVAHGDRDTVIPFGLGRELFERLDAPKQFVTLRGADHNDFFDAQHAPYWTPIRAFIDGL